jgi:hypothetical protein
MECRSYVRLEMALRMVLGGARLPAVPLAPAQTLGLQPLREARLPMNRSSQRFCVFMILKMNFNFNFKDIPTAPKASIRRLTTAGDWDHTVGIPR